MVSDVWVHGVSSYSPRWQTVHGLKRAVPLRLGADLADGVGRHVVDGVRERVAADALAREVVDGVELAALAGPAAVGRAEAVVVRALVDGADGSVGVAVGATGADGVREVRARLVREVVLLALRARGADGVRGVRALGGLELAGFADLAGLAVVVVETRVALQAAVVVALRAADVNLRAVLDGLAEGAERVLEVGAAAGGVAVLVALAARLAAADKGAGLALVHHVHHVIVCVRGGRAEAPPSGVERDDQVGHHGQHGETLRHLAGLSVN
jgi:hypothetical protein